MRIVSFIVLLCFCYQAFNKLITISWYEFNKQEITFLYCINKSKPTLHCEGKCYLFKKLAQEQKQESIPIHSQKEGYELQLFHSTNFQQRNFYYAYQTIILFYYLTKSTLQHKLEIFHPPQTLPI